MKTEWQSMASTNGEKEPIPQSREYWVKMAAMDQELILEQRDEISRLKRKTNKLQQRLAREEK